MSSYQVSIHVYDISGGLAKQFSPMFLGKQIEAIYHTGLLVYGKEYYYGGGICTGQPGQTPYGLPIKKEQLGTTQIPQETFELYLQEISKDFSLDSYDLINKNCNHFTDEAAKFLLGKGIPEYIMGLPGEVFSTPLGAMIKPIIEGMTKQMKEQFGGNMAGMFEGVNNQQAMFNQPIQQQQQQQQQNENEIKQISNLSQFLDICEQSNLLILNCSQQSCPPCLSIQPLFKSLAVEYKNKIEFYQTDVNKAVDICESLDVNKVPTFYFYNGLELIESLVAPSEEKLKNQVEKFYKENS